MGYIYSRWVEKQDAQEHFTDLDFSLEEKIIRVYQETVQRVPSSTEMVENARAITDGTLTIQGLEQQLIDSEEYQRVIKMQSNELAPELKKMISDKALVDLVSKLYVEERGTKIPEDMKLPLKDIYIYLDYNEFAMRAMYRTASFPRFQEDVLKTPELDKPKLIELFLKYYKVEDLVEEGKKIAQEIAAKAGKDAGAAGSGTGTKSTSSCPAPVPSEALKACTIDDKDSNMDPMLENILKCASSTFDKNQAARVLNDQSNLVKFPVRTHFGDMVLRPEQAWMVPMKQTPVCTTLGQQPLTQPVMTSSKLLLGTPLDDSMNTQVGSIMPKFEYTEFVDVPKGVTTAASDAAQKSCVQNFMQNAPKTNTSSTSK